MGCLKGWVHSNLWHVSVVDVFIAVPNTINQISLKGIQLKVYIYSNSTVFKIIVLMWLHREATGN